MRVVCIDPQSAIPGGAGAANPWLTMNREYDVLEIYAFPGADVQLRVRSDDGSIPALFDSASFMTVDGALPERLIVQVQEGGVLRIGPASWMVPGFWEAYFDKSPDAVETYEREVRPTD